MKAKGILGNRGESGGKCFEDTEVHTGQWYTFVPITDCIFESIVMPDMEDADTIMINKTFYAGVPWFGEVTSFKLASGAVQMIKY